MKLNNPSADIYVPDGMECEPALSRTTHLCIGAHQDDIEIMAYHGIAECFGRSDRWMTGVVVTNGAGSSRTGIYADYTDEDMQKVRHQEQRKAALIGEYAAQIQLGYTSSQVKNGKLDTVVHDLYEILMATKPTTLYLHNPADKHDTHVAVLIRSLAALRKMPAESLPAKIYGCEVWRTLDWLPNEDKVILPVSAYPNIAAALVGLFDSQISGGKRYDLATAGRRLANATYLDSHSTDEETAVTYAIDLMPLVEDRSIPLEEFIFEYLEKFCDDVRDRIKRLS